MTTPTTPKKRTLKVELYEVTDAEMLKRLDQLEWHPRWYVRTPVRTIGGEEIEIYSMPIDKNISHKPEEPMTRMFETEYMAKMFEKEDENFLYYNWTR